jgi:hypothetical protein
MDRILQDYRIDGRILTWEQLGHEAGLEGISGRTIRRHIGTIGYRKCLACRKGWVSTQTAQNRVNFASLMLSRYPEAKDWYDVRFSDEIHSGFGPKHTLHIIRKPGERYCSDCLQHAPEPNDSDLKRQHSWAAAGYNFKSQIIFYEVSTNSNGKISQQVYRDVILELIVKPWLKIGQNFVLKEDGDSGHSPEKKNIVRTWKEENGLIYYFNCVSLSDLAPIENCWQAPKQTFKKYPH